jgi:hypothetical protein
VVRKSLKAKAGKYGELDKPYIIATALRPSEFGFGLDESDQKQALFGKYQCVIKPNDETSLTFSGDGFWVHNSLPTNTRVSGVWFFDNADVYSLGRLRGQLYLNPWAKLPLHQALSEFSHTMVALDDGGKFKESERGINLLEVLGVAI